MSALNRIAPTRSNLIRTTRRLTRVTKGVDLLRRKREALVSELFKVARPAADARARIDAAGRDAYTALWEALAQHGRTGLAALAWPLPDRVVEIESSQVWGIPIAAIVHRPTLARTLPARGTAPGSTGPAAAGAAQAFERLGDLLLDAAPREMLMRRLGDALARATRQVNTLERRLAPALRQGLVRVAAALQEREREEQLRVRRLRRR